MSGRPPAVHAVFFVLEGAEALSEPEIDELEVLELFGDDPAEVRLCCQAKLIKTDAEKIVLSVHDS